MKTKLTMHTEVFVFFFFKTRQVYIVILENKSNTPVAVKLIQH